MTLFGKAERRFYDHGFLHTAHQLTTRSPSGFCMAGTNGKSTAVERKILRLNLGALQSCYLGRAGRCRRMRREGKSLCRAALHRGRSHKGIKAEVCWRLHIDRWACSSSWCTTYGDVVMHCNASSDLGRSVGASVKRRKDKQRHAFSDAAPRGMAKKVLWVRRCHDVSQVLL